MTTVDDLPARIRRVPRADSRSRSLSPRSLMMTSATADGSSGITCEAFAVYVPSFPQCPRSEHPSRYHLDEPSPPGEGGR
jgi:hypothetical protein